MENTIDKPKYELIQRDGEQMRYYPETGRLMRHNGTRWVYAKGTTANEPFNSETGAEAANQRWEMARDAWAEGTQDAIGAANEAEAVRKLAGVAVRHFDENGNAHLLKQIREGAGWIPERNQSAQQSADGLTLTLSGSLDAFRQQFGQQYTSEPQQGSIESQEED